MIELVYYPEIDKYKEKFAVLMAAAAADLNKVDYIKFIEYIKNYHV